MPLISDDTREEKLLSLLNTQYSELRDNNFISDAKILVYHEAEGVIIEVPLIEVPLKYPCTGKGARWSYEDLGRVVSTKALGYRQSIIAHSISDEDSQAMPACSTALLWVTCNYRPYRRLTIKANLKPGQ